MENEEVRRDHMDFGRDIGLNITWRKKNAKKEYTNITFVMADTYRNALQKLLRIKGGFEKIVIVSIQEYDRITNEYRNDPVTEDDEDGIIFEIYNEWKNSK